MGVVLLCVFVGAGGFVYWLPAAVCAVVSVAGGGNGKNTIQNKHTNPKYYIPPLRGGYIILLNPYRKKKGNSR